MKLLLLMLMHNTNSSKTWAKKVKKACQSNPLLLLVPIHIKKKPGYTECQPKPPPRNISLTYGNQDDLLVVECVKLGLETGSDTGKEYQPSRHIGRQIADSTTAESDTREFHIHFSIMAGETSLPVTNKATNIFSQYWGPRWVS